MATLNDYYGGFTDWRHEVLTSLRETALNAGPEVTEKLTYQLPFFFCLGKRFCYLSGEPGKVVLGLSYGAMLEDPYGRLESTHLKELRHLTFDKPEAVDPKVVQYYLQHAAEIAAAIAQRAAKRAGGR